MKLAIPLYSQRDPRWASVLLGYNTSSEYTLGMYGCLLTCYAMYLKALGKDETPKTVNDKLKANNGFVSGGLLVWSAIPKTFGLTEYYVSPKYTGPVTTFGVNRLKELLDDKHPLICEIDFNPATEANEQHFVLVTGYEGDTVYINDPWTGTAISLDVYGGAKRAIVHFRAYDRRIEGSVVPDVQKELDTCRVDRDNHWNFILEIAQLLNVAGQKDVIREEIKKMLNLETALREKEKQLEELKAKLDKYEVEIQMLQVDHETMVKELSEKEKTVQDQGLKINELSRALQDLKEVSEMVNMTWQQHLGRAIKLLFIGR